MHRRPGGDHVVHDRNVTVDGGTRLESIRHVRPPRGGVRQQRLGCVGAVASSHDPTQPDATALSENARDFQCLIESASAQARRRNRHRDKPVDRGPPADSAIEHPGECRNDTQIAVEFQSTDEIVDRRCICERTDGAIHRWRSGGADPTQRGMRHRARPAGRAWIARHRQLAHARVAEIGQGARRLVAEQADSVGNEPQRTVTVRWWTRKSIMGRIRCACRALRSRALSDIVSTRPGTRTHTRRLWPSSDFREEPRRRLSIESP